MVTFAQCWVGVALWVSAVVLGIQAMAPTLDAYPCARPHRSKAQVRAFMRQQPCPAGPDAGSTRRCRGYEVDHVIPLACCGLDIPSNMQWLTKEANRRKGARGCQAQ